MTPRPDRFGDVGGWAKVEKRPTKKEVDGKDWNPQSATKAEGDKSWNPQPIKR